MSTDIPEPWASVMVAADLVDPRYSDPRPSMRRLADEAGTTTSTISAMIHGTRDTSGAIIQRVAVALKMGRQAEQVSQWVGLARSQPRPFQAHRDADLLTAEEQEAVNELIRLLALPKKQGGGERDRSSAQKTPARGGRANALRNQQGAYELAADEDPVEATDEAAETESST